MIRETGATDAPGFSPEEIERGDDKPGCRFPLWGCFLSAAIIVLLVYGAYRFAIRIGFAASAGS
jgi:hypothetical protein